MAILCLVAGDQSSRVGRGLAIAVVAAIVVMWLYVFSGAAAQNTPDKLDDTEFTTAAEIRCAQAAEDLDALPPAAEADSATARAAVLDEANLLLVDMAADLGALEVDNDRDRELVDLWLADWRTFIEDRGDYADELRVDDEAELLVTARGGRQISLTIDRFAAAGINNMESCMVPLDA